MVVAFGEEVPVVGCGCDREVGEVGSGNIETLGGCGGNWILVGI